MSTRTIFRLSDETRRQLDEIAAWLATRPASRKHRRRGPKGGRADALRYAVTRLHRALVLRRGSETS